ncbi:MAG: hypothetical protein H6833_06220 [Planctomycetes bacterium]|nr:hypothetical protein [Planctomycetota bacterium]
MNDGRRRSACGRRMALEALLAWIVSSGLAIVLIARDAGAPMWPTVGLVAGGALVVLLGFLSASVLVFAKRVHKRRALVLLALCVGQVPYFVMRMTQPARELLQAKTYVEAHAQQWFRMLEGRVAGFPPSGIRNVAVEDEEAPDFLHRVTLRRVDQGGFVTFEYSTYLGWDVHAFDVGRGTWSCETIPW